MVYRKIRETFRTLQSKIEKTKKDTLKEMENNERLTSIQSKLEEDIKCNEIMILADREKSDVLEYKTLEIVKLSENNEQDYETILNVSRKKKNNNDFI